MSTRIELWDKLPCASGTRLGVVKPATGQVTQQLTNEDSLTVTVPADEPWLSDLAAGKVLVLADTVYGNSDWVISEVQDGAGTDGTVTILARSPLALLGELLMADVTTGGSTAYNLGGWQLTAEQYIDHFVVAACTAAGMTWVTRGTVEPTVLMDIAWERWTPLQLLQELALPERTGCELVFRKNETTDYKIDLLFARGADAAQVLLHSHKNAYRVRRTRRSDTYRNAIVAHGATPEGALEAATIGRGTWKVAGISGSVVRLQEPTDSGYGPGLWGDTSDDGTVNIGDAQQLALYVNDPTSPANPAACAARGDVNADGVIDAADVQEIANYTVGLPCAPRIGTPVGGARGPAQYADQFNGCYLLKTDGTLVEITDSTADSRFTLASVTGIAVGDHVEIRADSSGTLLTALDNPAEVTSFGRTVVGTLEVPGARGERNHVKNPAMSDWNTVAEGIWGRIATDYSSAGYVTTIDVKDLPADFALKAGDRLHWYDSASTSGTIPNIRKLTGDVTASGTGTATVNLNGSLSNPPLDSHFIIFPTGDGSRLPAGWTEGTGSAGDVTEVVRRNAPMNGTTLSCAVQGAHTASRKITVDGLTAGAKIYAGDILDSSSDGEIVADATADGSGVAVIYVRRAITLADNASVTIRQPQADSVGSPYAAVVMTLSYSGTNSLTTGAWFQSPAYVVKYDPALPTLWCSAGLTLFGAATLASADLNNYPPMLGLMDVSGTAAVRGSVTDADRALAVTAPVDVTLRCSYTMTANDTYAVRIKPASTDAVCETIVRWVTLFLTNDPTCPFVLGSHANTLWHAANAQLVKSSAVATYYELSFVDLARMAGWTSADEALTLGGTVRIKDADYGIDDTVRVVGITAVFRGEAVDPFAGTVMLDSIPQRLGDALKKRTAVRQYVKVNTAAAGATPTYQYVAASTATPVLVPGATRAVDDGSGTVIDQEVV